MSANPGRTSYQTNIQAQRFTPSPFTDGGFPAPHPQNPYQTQGPPQQQQQQQQQTNPAQNLSNSAPQSQGRLTSMAPPTAPPTPPTQQGQQQQTQQPNAYAVPQGSVQQSRAPPQYARPQQQQVRRQQQPSYMFPTQTIPQYNFVIPTGHIRQTMPISAQHFQQQVYQMPQYYFNPPTQTYSQMTGPPANGQRQTTTPNPGPAATIGPPANEYPYVYEIPQVIQQQPAAPPQQKTGTKKAGPNAIQIINPITGKNIFEEDAPASANNEDKTQSHHQHSHHQQQHHHHNSGSKEDSVEKENAEPQTPVVSAMSDGPSVDITPKHQISKNKSRKPPEPSPQQSPVQSSQSSQPAIPQLVDPPKPVKIEAPKQEVEQPQPVVPHVIASSPVQDSENNNNNNNTNINDNDNNNISSRTSTSNVNITPVVIMQQPQQQISETTTEKPTTPPPSSEQNQIPNQVSDINDTNNNNYQKVTSSSSSTPSNEIEEEIINEQIVNDNDETDRAVVAEVPQDTNNNSTETEEKGAKIESLIQYVDDQWSPENPAGKKYYTRDQLLKLKDALAVAPVDLPEGVSNTLMKFNKEYLTNTLNQQLGLRMPFDAINSVAPKWMNTPGGRSPYPPKRPSQQGKQQIPGGGRQGGQSDRQIIKLHLSLQDDVKLNESENAWKPTHLKKRPDMNEEERETSDVLSKFRSMLNKLTAENFDVLVEQVKTYKIDTMERLDGVIGLLFEKAISEPKFAPTYANLCNEIANIQTVQTNADQPQDKQSKKNSLKVRLITQCQKEFERNKEDSLEFRVIEDKLRENENEPDQQKREERKAELEEHHYRLRQRANGTVKFIGELYKIEMLTTKIMRTCIEMLLNEATEEKVERVCKLLTTIGGKMEASEGRSSLQRYFNILNEMTHPAHKSIRSSRIKFEIQNLQDLRSNNWKARRQDLIPKTMDQMVWEAEQEQMMNNYQNRQSAKEDRQRGNQGYNKRQQPQQDSDGWSVQQNTKSRNQPIQLNKISLPSMSDSSAKLGNASQFQNFMMQTNKFAGLTVDGDSEMPPRFNSGSKNSSMERGDRGSRFYNNGGDNNRYGGRGSSNQGSRNSSQIRSRDNSGSRGGNGGPSRSLQPPPPRHQQPIGASMSFSGTAPMKKPISPIVLTEEEVDKNVKELVTIVDLYRDDKLTVDAAIEKARKHAANKEVLEAIYNKFLDRKDNDRENLMMIVVEMIKNKLVARDDNKQALYKVMQFAPDIQCDVPRVYEYIAQFMGELLIANVLTFQEVYHVSQADECDKENVLRFIFTTVEKRHSANKLQSIVAETNCDLGQFIKDGNFGRWLETNNFTSMVRRGTRGIADVMQQMKRMLQEKSSNDNIMDYIQSTDCTKDPNFIRQLTTIVMEFCCDEYSTGQTQPSYKLNNVKLESLSLLLQRYIDNEINRELQCIYALQHFAFVREYPPGLLNSIFEVLYDNDVLSVEAFEKWKNSDDPSENQGKGVAVCSTRQFFTKLAEDEDDDDDTGSN
ncbi:unnamed protein product [Chironomus riparius]|uniref:Uncharacterized protein n=1 Tax=Chironomus riparius TaxID=315576 RepID=A0A9P0JAZ2_9DIPT|nr:unnamed protein product [Chironomus riparius]